MLAYNYSIFRFLFINKRFDDVALASAPASARLVGESLSRRIASRFPSCDFCVAGSGVFQQASYEDAGKSGVEKPMIDMIIGTSNPRVACGKRCAERSNSAHPFRLDRSGKWIAQFQDTGGAHMYFNPYAKASIGNGRNVDIKYGVISIDRLEDDLSNWTTLYCAGRLQKPVLVHEETDTIRGLREKNLRAAVCAALALLPGRFSDAQLYETIAGISYLGDPRFAVGAENKDKVQNIVAGSLASFRDLYADAVGSVPWIDVDMSSGSCTRTAASRNDMLSK